MAQTRKEKEQTLPNTQKPGKPGKDSAAQNKAAVPSFTCQSMVRLA